MMGDLQVCKCKKEKNRPLFVWVLLKKFLFETSAFWMRFVLE